MMMMSLVIWVSRVGERISLGKRVSRVGEHMSLVIYVSSVGERIPLAIWVKTRSSKSRKIGIFPKSLVHGFDKNWQFFHFYILGKIGQENVFHDILERKKRPERTIKTRSSKSRKTGFFQRSIVLVKNRLFFHLFIFGKVGRESVFHDILQREKAFLDYKNKKFKKLKNWDFCNGVSSWLWSKLKSYFV